MNYVTFVGPITASLEIPDLEKQYRVIFIVDLSLSTIMVKTYVMDKLILQDICSQNEKRWIETRHLHFISPHGRAPISCSKTHNDIQRQETRKCRKKIYLLILFSGSDYLHLFTPCKKRGLHIFTTVSHRKTTIFKGKYSINFYHVISYTVYLSFGTGIRLRQIDRQIDSLLYITLQPKGSTSSRNDPLFNMFLNVMFSTYFKFYSLSFIFNFFHMPFPSMPIERNIGNGK